MGIIIQKLIAYLMPVVGGFVADWLANHTGICPVSNAVFCTFWPTLVGAALGGLGLIGIHPNGTNGSAKPTADVFGKVSSALGARFSEAVGKAADGAKPQTPDPHTDG